MSSLPASSAGAELPAPTASVEQAILDPLHASIEIGDHADLSLGEKPHLLEHRLLLGAEPTHDQDHAVADAELVKLAQAERRRRVHALHHAEIEDEVAHPVPNDQVAAGLDQAAREGEEEISLQAESAADSALLLKNGRGLERALLVGAVSGHGEIVANVVRPAVAVGEEEGGDEEAEGDARDDAFHRDEDEDGHDEGVLADGEPEERVPHPFAEQGQAEEDQEPGEDGARKVEEQRREEERGGRAQVAVHTPAARLTAPARTLRRLRLTER